MLFTAKLKLQQVKWSHENKDNVFVSGFLSAQTRMTTRVKMLQNVNSKKSSVEMSLSMLDRSYLFVTPSLDSTSI